MSTLEKTIGFIDSDTHETPSDLVSVKRETIQSMLGIAHEYANPALIEQEEGAFERAIAEVVYVLKSIYSTPKGKIKSIIRGLSDIIRIENADCVIYAIDLFSSTSLDFVDCLLVAYHSLNGETVFTFDKKLNKHLNMDTM